MLVTITALCSTSSAILFTVDCKPIMIVYHLVPNIQDGGGKPEVQFTFL